VLDNIRTYVLYSPAGEHVSYGYAMGDFKNRTIDMICRHNKDGTMMPIRFRMTDDDGLIHEYRVKTYKDLSHKGTFEMPNGVTATSTIFPFTCKIDCFGTEKELLLYYNSSDHVWTMAVPARR
jgi:hypothetical protein